MIHRTAPFFLASALLLLTVCAPATAPEEAAGYAAAESGWIRRQSNLILITVDTLRADRLGYAGPGQAETPWIDRLAGDGIVFSQAIAQVPLTLPSHVCLFTGNYPNFTGVRDQAGFQLAPEAVTLAEVLGRQGYRTGAFVAASVLDSRTGLDQGFDHYSDPPANDLERPGEVVLGEALSWIQEPGRGRFFSWIHLFEPHAPYHAPEPFKSRYADDPYNGEVAYVDSLLGRFFQALQEAGLYEDSLIIFTSDHGESLGEHGEETHGFFLYDATLRVPLIVKPPPGRLPRRSVEEQVRLIDLFPTILQFLGLPQPDNVQGTGLLSLVTGSAARAVPVAYSETYYPYYHFGWSPLHAVRTGEYKYIQAPRPELYDLKNDPRETLDRSGEQSSLAARMQETAAQYARFAAAGAPAGAPAAVDRETMQRLRSLGYLSLSRSAPPPADFSSLPDPKDKISLYNLLQDALRDGNEGRVEASTAKLREVIRQDDSLLDAWLNLGANQAQAGRYGEGIRAFQRALELDPNNLFALFNLGLCHANRGEWEQAIRRLGQLLEIDSGDVQARIALGRVHQLRGDTGRAIEMYERILSQNPDLKEARDFLQEARAQRSPLNSKR